jgi:glutaredoxin
MLTNLSLILLFVVTVISPAQAEVSMWFDADGEPHYIGSETDDASFIEHRKPASPANKSQAVASHVDLYITRWCPYCKKAIIFLHKNNIAFNEYDIEQDFDAAARKEKLASDYSGVPLAVINGITIRGFSESKYREALEKEAN